jgi:hypothetical protein
MSALAMILTAAMAVPGDGPESVTGEVARSQPLDLRGEWRGTVRNYYGLYATVQVGGGRLKSEDKTMPGGFAADCPVSFTDEGNGQLRMRLNDDQIYLGIYRQEGDRLIACFSREHRPSEFRLAEKQGLIILHRVKSRK